ncbi:transcriptional regulator [Microtetraspora sp. NBRC 13810]|uniref:ArsR/SmtB family transcription factor n=1 Tax=Microtetraspora sp. NBRC 13810 TaxID=3030990 RepID=UPI0024A3B89D|nr:helix-turn-helix domain-containing protein [Microtetraspora sp. NBRC 13810]GLW12730.1 transcriptional regulator [Microtetraspora sp. NBRC 13810]
MAPRAVDTAALKALGHPLRQRILRHLAREGPANSTALGKALDESTGTLSYHLRLLQRAGFVEEVPERATGRERWWRGVPTDLRWPAGDDVPEEQRPVLDEIIRTKAAEDLDLFHRFADAARRHPAWTKGSRGLLHLTEEGMDRFFEDYIELLRRHGHRPEDAPPGSRPVFVRFFTIPADLAED